MRSLAIAALMSGLALPLIAQEVKMPGATALDDPALIEGLEAVPDNVELAGEVAEANAAARPDVDPATLADMQEDLRAVAADLQSLRAELIASGAQGFSAAGGDSAIDRMNALEARIAILTEQTELLSNRIRKVVADGSNRVGDIEFRLCELDENCDLGALMTRELGRQATGEALLGQVPPPADLPSDISTATLPPPEEPSGNGTPPTEEEAREIAAARAAIDEGAWAAASEQLDHLVQAHAGGPLTAEALFLLGVARQEGGATEQAAEAWLRAFSAEPDGAFAPRSLIALSRAVAQIGDASDACPYLGELTRRFPDAPEATDAATLEADAGCEDFAPSDRDG
ncbi:tetratricopeptide repeat protein [Paracoccus sediminicola]|uniref:tetratricopeptide repeat protein n=1 Tax=Paracoccus sediminicola TaxID=3017783 RepID=UPI0022F0F775|nr:tol-pal system protein [Paracoccus sediminicola]WBU56842.1 tol-pal system protein [Paracoccus sediminicola]